MDGTIHHQLLSFWVAKKIEEYDWKKRETSSTSGNGKDLLWKDSCNSRLGPSPRYSDFKDKVSLEPLWLISRDTPSWVIEELRSGDPCQSMSEIAAFVASLRACTRNKDLARGTSIHNDLVQRGLLQKCSHALVIMYAKCGELVKAKELLDMHRTSSHVVTWTALIAGYAREGHGQNALDCYEQMQSEGILPNAVTFICTLNACATIGAGAVDKGKQIHDEIARKGLLQNNIVLGGALVHMYAKCGAVSKARQVLDGLSSRNVVSWNALIAGYTQEGHVEQALNCLDKMQCESILPDAVTFICILKACARIGVEALDKGKQIHDEIARQGLLQNDIVLGGALVDMYAKCGAVSTAQQVLDGLPSRNVIAWSALIAGYTHEGNSEQALNCFEKMQCEGILPDAVTFICIVKAYAMIGARAADKGKQIHDEIVREGLLQIDDVLGGALVDMYAKCGTVSMARQVLDGLPSRNVVSWSALIAGYIQEGQAEQALNCFEEMQREGILPDAVTFISLLKACGTIGAGAVDKGKQIHDEIARQGLLRNDIVLGGALVDMYAKCGAFSKARQVLDGLPSRNAVSWNALIAGYTQEGHAEQALNCFEEMQRDGILPDVVTYGCVLNVCNHRGLVEEGEEIFVNMSTKYGMNPNLECNTYMVDLFGRAGHLEKAVSLIQDMPSSDYSIIWHTLLGACREWVDVDVGRWAFERAVKLDECDGLPYVLMANIYATAGMRQKAEDIEAMRIRNGAWKQPGCNKVIHEFSVSDAKYLQ